MANTIINYPRVSVTYNASLTQLPTAAENNATILFAPFISNKGPANKPTYISSYSDFVSLYGTLDYNKNGQQVLNIGNWLNSFGQILAYRIVDFDSIKLTGGINDIDLTNALSDTDLKSFLNFYSLVLENGSTVYFVNGVELDNDLTSFVDTYTLSVESDGSLKIGEENLTNNSRNVSINDPSLYALYGTDISETALAIKSIKFIYRSKNIGSDYQNFKLSFEGSSIEKTFNIVLSNNNKVIQTIRNRTLSNYKSALIKDEDPFSYIDMIYINGGFDITSTIGYSNYIQLIQNKIDGDNISSAFDAIADPLVYPCDVVLDAGFSSDVKQAIVNKIENVRYDVFSFLDYFENKNNKMIQLTSAPTVIKGDNFAIYQQYGTTEDIYSTVSQGEIKVTPTYFLANLIPFNDRQYGYGKTPVGLRYGVLNDVISINQIPNSDEKEEWFQAGINYIEKDSRSTQFFTQRTMFEVQDGFVSALQFINNSRIAKRIGRDVTNIARWEIGEVNDNTTVTNLRDKINRYLDTWVQLRVLSSKEVIVEIDPFDNVILNVTLNILFNGTIEYIPIVINL